MAFLNTAFVQIAHYMSKISNSENQNASKNRGRATTLHNSSRYHSYQSMGLIPSETVQCTICAAVLGSCVEDLSLEAVGKLKDQGSS